MGVAKKGIHKLGMRLMMCPFRSMAFETPRQTSQPTLRSTGRGATEACVKKSLLFLWSFHKKPSGNKEWNLI